MFGLSTWEVLIILALALIFVGPDQLPKVARQIGKGVRQVRGAMGKVDDEMRRAMREAAAEVDDDGKPVGTLPDAAGPHEAPPEGSLPPAGLRSPDDTRAQGQIGRDWSQIGKTPVPGRVATATPARPTDAAPATGPDVTKADAPTTEAKQESEPAAPPAPPGGPTT